MSKPSHDQDPDVREQRAIEASAEQAVTQQFMQALEHHLTVEIEPIGQFVQDGVTVRGPVAEDDPSVVCWSVFLRRREGDCDSLAECPNRIMAEIVAHAMRATYGFK